MIAHVDDRVGQRLRTGRPSGAVEAACRPFIVRQALVIKSLQGWLEIPVRLSADSRVSRVLRL